jgi:peptidoglycan hydrolase-like protein with peptidoglycan-binding domain
MTAVGLHTVVELARPRWRHVVALAVAIGSVATASSIVRADQTVFFDEAGDAPHISLVGDSTLTGVRWYADYGALERFNFVFSAESCRRTFEQSCISQEGYRSENVISAMRTLDGELGDVLVVMAGYNDPGETIDEAIAGVVDEARDQGLEHVVWLSLRTSDGVNYSDPQEQSSINTFREYNEQLFDAAEASDGYLQIADWAAYSNGASAWFETDGVHLTSRGVDAVTTFIAGTVERVLAGENVSPAAAPWTVLVPGAEGELVEAVQDALIAAGVEVPGGADGVYGNDTMASVAEYQRRAGGLQVTGAVDIATARSLGLLDDPNAVDEATPTTAPPAPTTVTAVTAPAQGAGLDSSTEPTESDGGAMSRWQIVTALAVVVLAAAVVARRRHVVAQRAGRRWSRVHPSTSPRRSVADMRRTGELPTIGATRAAPAVYDHELEEPNDSLADAESHSAS